MNWEISAADQSIISKPLSRSGVRFFFYCGCILKLLIVSSVPSAPVLQPCDVFEQPHPAGPKKIEFHISVPEATSTVERSGPGQEESADGVQGKVFLHLNGDFFFFIFRSGFVMMCGKQHDHLRIQNL